MPSRPDLKSIVEYAAMATQTCGMRHRTRTRKDLDTLVNKHNVKVMETPREILMEVLKAWDKVAEKYLQRKSLFQKSIRLPKGLGPADRPLQPGERSSL